MAGESTTSGGTTGTKTFLRIVGLPAATFFVFLASGTGPDVAKTALPVLVVLAIVTYFLPTIEAALRKHPSLTSIGLVNLFLGWSLLGWVAAIAWACAGSDKSAKPEAVKAAEPPAIPARSVADPALASSIADELQKLVALRDQGVLTDDEFSQQKAKLLV